MKVVDNRLLEQTVIKIKQQTLITTKTLKQSIKKYITKSRGPMKVIDNRTTRNDNKKIKKQTLFTTKTLI